jgi:P27 family predicted phage terminase small subunit
MTGGRHPAPVELKVLKGVRPGRINARAPQPREARPVAPRGMGRVERAVFAATLAELEAMGIAGSADGLVLEVLARTVRWHRQAAAQLEAEGLTSDGAKGGEVCSPAWRVFRDSGATTVRIAAELGLTPSARSRIVVGRKPDDDDDGLLT